MEVLSIIEIQKTIGRIKTYGRVTGAIPPLKQHFFMILLGYWMPNDCYQDDVDWHSGIDGDYSFTARNDNPLDGEVL